MKRYGNLFEKIVDIDNLRLAHQNAKKGKRYYKEVKMVDSNIDFYLYKIQEMLINGTYEVSPYKRQIINDKGKERELMKLPYYPDRIIQWAIMLQIEPIFMKVFCNHTCASIKNRGTKKAYRLTQKYLKDKENTKYCLKLDVNKFYPSINQSILKSMLRKKFKDKQLLSLLDKIIDSYKDGIGVPIGSYLSQYLANFYLAYLDHYIKEELHCKYVVRYMDDIIIFDSSKQRLHEIRRKIEEYLHSLDLQLKDNYQVFPTRIRGVDFVGYRFFGEYTLLRKRISKNYKKVCLQAEKKQNINYHDFCSINSYKGWLESCDCYRLKIKFFYRIKQLLINFYSMMINTKEHKNRLNLLIVK